MHRLRLDDPEWPKASAVKLTNQKYLNCPWSPAILYEDGRRARLRLHFTKQEWAQDCARTVIAERRRLLERNEADAKEA